VPTYYKSDDPDYLEAITPPELRWAGQATREVMPGWDLGAIVMSEDVSDPAAPVVSILKIAPGDTLPRHAHDCFRVEVIIQGSISLPDGTVLRSGDIMVSQPRVYYGPHVAGSEGCLSAEIFSAARGMSPISDTEDAVAAAVSERVQEATARLRSETASPSA